MTRRRWIADEVSGNRAALVGEHADHLFRVLRARVGEEFDIATGHAVRRGKITLARADRVEFELGEEIEGNFQPPITLLLAIFKFDRMEWAIEKCTELGVSRIVPVISHRTDAHLVAASAKRVERWRRIARQASEQSRRATPPEIAAPVETRRSLESCGKLASRSCGIGGTHLAFRCAKDEPVRVRHQSRGRSRGRLDRGGVTSVSASRMDFRLFGKYDPPRRNRRNRCCGGCGVYAIF